MTGWESLRDVRQPLPQDGPCYHDCRFCEMAGGCLRGCCGYGGVGYVCVKPIGHTGNHRTVRCAV